MENLFRAIAGSSIQQYYGYAFERLCEDGMDAILERLGIALADIVEMGPFFQQSRGQQERLHRLDDPTPGLGLDHARDHVLGFAARPAGDPRR